MTQPHVDGFRAPLLSRLTGLTYRQLDYWARTDLLRPSISEARGSGTARRYSYDDARIALAIKRCLDAGMSLQTVRSCTAYLRDPENCDLLYVGGNGIVGVCTVEVLAEIVLQCGGLLTIVSIAALDADLDAALRAVRTDTASATEMRERFGKEAS